jgi:hypothetical protein
MKNKNLNPTLKISFFILCFSFSPYLKAIDFNNEFSIDDYTYKSLIHPEIVSTTFESTTFKAQSKLDETAKPLILEHLNLGQQNQNSLKDVLNFFKNNPELEIFVRERFVSPLSISFLDNQQNLIRRGSTAKYDTVFSFPESEELLSIEHLIIMNIKTKNIPSEEKFLKLFGTLSFMFDKTLETLNKLSEFGIEVMDLDSANILSDYKGRIQLADFEDLISHNINSYIDKKQFGIPTITDSSVENLRQPIEDRIYSFADFHPKNNSYCLAKIFLSILSNSLRILEEEMHYIESTKPNQNLISRITDKFLNFTNKVTISQHTEKLRTSIDLFLNSDTFTETEYYTSLHLIENNLKIFLNSQINPTETQKILKKFSSITQFLSLDEKVRLSLLDSIKTPLTQQKFSCSSIL